MEEINPILDEELKLFFLDHPEAETTFYKASKDSRNQSDFIHRYMLEVVRGEDPAIAAKVSEKALSFKPRIFINEPEKSVKEIKNVINRDETMLAPGKQLREGKTVIVNLSSTHTVSIAKIELISLLNKFKEKEVVLTFDLGEKFSSRVKNDKRYIVIDPFQTDNEKQLINLLNEDKDLVDRKLFSWDKKIIGEQDLQLKGLKEYLTSFFVKSKFNMPEKNMEIQFDEPTILELIDALEKEVEELYKDAKIIIPSKTEYMHLFKPANDWELRKDIKKTVIETITQDNKYLNNFIHNYPDARVGFLSLAPDDDLMDVLLMPSGEAGLVLKKEALKDAIFFSHNISPKNTFYLGDSSSNDYQDRYRCISTEEKLLEMIKIKCLLQFSFAAEESMNKFFRGGHHLLSSRNTASGPLSYLIGNIASYVVINPNDPSKSIINIKGMQRVLRNAIILAAQRALMDIDELGYINCLYYGDLNLEMIELATVQARDLDEFMAYHERRSIKKDLYNTANYYMSNGIKFKISAGPGEAEKIAFMDLLEGGQ